MKHGDTAEFTTGFSVQGKCNGIEDGRFSGAGIAGDQKQTITGESFEVNDSFIQIGTEGGHGQLFWSHGSTSHISPIRSAMMADCSALISELFCAS